MTEYPKSLFEQALNETYSGTKIYIRDTSLSKDMVQMYQPGMILHDHESILCSSLGIGGMKTNLRFMIISSHMVSLDNLIETTSSDSLKDRGMHLSEKNAHFKVLDNYEYQKKTLITLLHLPDNTSWKFFESVDTASEFNKDLIESCRKSFEKRCSLPVRKELDISRIELLWMKPIGFMQPGKLYTEEDLVKLDDLEDIKSSPKYQIRYVLEHRILPKSVLEDANMCIPLLLEGRQDFLLILSEKIAESMQEANPFTGKDFEIRPFSQLTKHGCFVIEMPEAEYENQCLRIYIAFDVDKEKKEIINPRYFTIEKSGSDINTKKTPNFLCEWIADRVHRNFGPVQSKDEELPRILALLEKN